MLGSIFSSVGNYFGGQLGGGILSTLGRYAGRMAGNFLEKQWFQRKEFAHKFINLRDSFNVTRAEYGRPIALIFGRMRVPGQIIWCDEVRSHENISSISKYFQARNTTLTTQTSEFDYSASFAMALCEGEILEINRVWHHDELIDLSNYKFRLYKGDQTQEADELIRAKCGGMAPGYRGLAYIVFEDLPLADFGDVIPNFSFEVTRKSNLPNYESIENMIESMVMIPGSGEYVYDTIVQSKRQKDAPSFMASDKINSHNEKNIADSVQSLNQLQEVCENVKWVAPVVCWFGNSVDAAECVIKPGIEFRDDKTVFSEEWRVGEYDRSNAYEIRKDEFNNPLYGGSVNDQSILRYLKELRDRQLKIMFYPMFFLDVGQKPWRGRVSGNAASIKDFFRRKAGYNEFILHYARLVKGYVDAFIIGSEMIGLTRVREGNSFPAVDELIELAREVKNILGPEVKVSYAADWSEYHHTEGGWFNLDPLWSSADIDFIGIDAYFPATDMISSSVDSAELIQGWSKGEGYDYYINEAGEQERLEPQYAWKNLGYWWKNRHINPDGNATNWVPKSKPIWFTEYGFPSIDKGPNQPNLFFDPKCVEGGAPKYSNGNVDFAIQRKSIYAFIKYWQTQEYIEQMFLWTWDARPFPAWPHSETWNDGYLWHKGHWVNNKLGHSNLAAIILEISLKSKLDISKVDVSSVDIPVEGAIFSNKISAISAIDTLRAAYFFDMKTTSDLRLSFVKRGFEVQKKFLEADCIKINENSFITELEIPDNVKLSELDLYYIESVGDYDRRHVAFNSEANSFAARAAINLPVAFSEHDAIAVGELVLRNAEVEDSLIRFVVPYNAGLLPCDFVRLQAESRSYDIRIIKVVSLGLLCEVSAIIDKREFYLSQAASNDTVQSYKVPSAPSTIDGQLIIDLISSDSAKDAANILISLIGQSAAPLYAKFLHDSRWQKLTDLLPTPSVNLVKSFMQTHAPNIFLIDESSHLIVESDELQQCRDQTWQQALVGEEMLSFYCIQRVDHKTYKLSHLIRGMKGTHEYMSRHNEPQRLTLLGRQSNLLSVPKQLLNQLINFKIGGNITAPVVNVRHQENSIYLVENRLDGNGLYLRWAHRDFSEQEWVLACENNVLYKIIITHGTQRIMKWVKLKNYLLIEDIAISGEYSVDIIPSVMSKYKMV